MKVHCVVVWEAGEMKTEVWAVFSEKEKAFAYVEELKTQEWLIENGYTATVSTHIVDESEADTE